MRAKNKAIGAVGAALGLVLAVTMATAPASARPAPAPVTSTSSCASFEGLTVTAPSVRYDGVGLHAGETITVRVSPAAASDTVVLFASVGISFIIGGGPATEAYAFTSGTSTVYSMNWSYSLPDNSTSTTVRTWTFDCSSTTVAAPAPEPTPTTDPVPTKRKGKPRP